MRTVSTESFAPTTMSGLTSLLGGVGSDRIVSKPTEVWEHRIRLTGPLGRTEDYMEELNLLETMEAHDHATLVINTGGGSLQTLLEFVSAIENCKGHVHGYLPGEAFSAGSVLFLKCHSFSLSRYAQMMIHMPIGDLGGKFSDSFKEVEHYKEWVSFFYTDVYKGFLNDDELSDVIKGGDIWLGSDAIYERLQKLAEYRESVAPVVQEEQKEASEWD